MKSIGRQLKIARGEKGMSQSQFSKWLGLNLDTYQNLEQGRTKPSADIFIKIMIKVKLTLD